MSGQCRSDQKDLLLQFKNSISFNVPRSKKLPQWNQNLDCCSWDGVTCEDGRVTGLNLSSEWISGEIGNSSLFNLKYLRHLDLSYNNFNSTIPAMIGNLANLTYLNLSNAGFGGQISQEISQLTRLVTLEISSLPYLQVSSLTLENPNLSMLVRNLSKLEELYLDGVNISAPGSEWCQGLSSSLPDLRVLSLSNCSISGPIHESLGNLQSLKVIRLDANNLSATVPGFIAKFSNLNSLRLSSCGLYGTFPKEIFQVPTLQIIDISNNPLLHGSLLEFPKNSAFQGLILSSTNFSGNLTESIGNLRNLSRLDLSNCQFHGTLPRSTDQLTKLVYLDLSNNSFTGPVPYFNMFNNLTKIVLSYNSLAGAISSAHWEGLMKLLVVDLRNNLLNGSIPSSLFSLPSLEVVQLSHNQFDGQIPEFFSASSSLLDTIDLSINNLEGPIPMSIFDLRKLNILLLSSNKISGTIQLDKFQGCRNLTTLDLSYNNLSVVASENDPTWSSFSKMSTLKLASCKLKRFPYLRNQSKLETLDLSNNQINGKVPNWIWELGNGHLRYLNLSCNNLTSLQEPRTLPSNLNFLDLHSNQIRGNLPILPPVISYVDFSYNKFSSSIPNAPESTLSFLYYYSLANNGLRGVIPQSFCNASYLLVLDLSRNMLSGKVPECLSRLSQSLGVLNLQRNNFSGQIPDSFPVNCALETIDLNGNVINGQIPKSLANCKKLEVLNLGNNNLSDKFPCVLINTSSLRVLVLRSNKFYGSIGCRKPIGTWENLQIVDLAHNEFDGNLPGECFKRWQAMTIDEDGDQSELKHLKFEVLKFDSQMYYQDTVTVTIKGLELELQKILTVFTSIDLSSNNFYGPIPGEIGQLRALYVLNLSHNALTGEIPSSVGNLQQLESLDLSSNNISGSIPASLIKLTFLSFLNLSFNQLVGMIPMGSQFSTFSAESFTGNKGLCGFPLLVKCSSDSGKSPDTGTEAISEVEFNWQSIYSGIGFGVGSGAVVALLTFWDDGKKWLEDSIDKILMVILPVLGYAYKPRDQWDDNEDTEDEASDFAEDQEEDEAEDRESRGRYCVFCSKFDITMTRVIHDPKCTCHSSPPSSSSSSSSTSSSYSP